MKCVPTISKINFEENDMCLKKERPTVAAVSLRGFDFERLARVRIKVVCMGILAHDSFGFKTKLSVANRLTFETGVHNSFCRNGRSNRLTGLQNAGGDHAE